MYITCKGFLSPGTKQSVRNNEVSVLSQLVYKQGFDCKLMQVLSMPFINTLLFIALIPSRSIHLKTVLKFRKRKRKSLYCFHPPQKGTFMSQSCIDVQSYCLTYCFFEAVSKYGVHTKNCNHFSRTFQGPLTRNIISQTVQKCTFPVHSNTLRLFPLHFPVHLSYTHLIVKYCMKHRALM